MQYKLYNCAQHMKKEDFSLAYAVGTKTPEGGEVIRAW